MAEKPYDVVVKVISQKGSCAAGHKVGDQWVLGSSTPAGLCISAMGSIIPNFRVLRFGGTFPWSSDPDTATVACTDGDNPVIFELRRVRK